jgi:hypothetical protein
MGQRRNAEIEAWQRASGVKPSKQHALLREMSDAAVALIRVIELERSGIRDGDGCWSGSDAMGGITHDLTSLIEEYERRMTAQDAAERPSIGGGELPF